MTGLDLEIKHECAQLCVMAGLKEIIWKIGRVVEYDGLENRYTISRIIGSNPIFSASRRG